MRHPSSEVTLKNTYDMNALKAKTRPRYSPERGLQLCVRSEWQGPLSQDVTYQAHGKTVKHVQNYMENENRLAQ